MDYFDVLFFVVAADVVGFAYLPFLYHFAECAGVIFYIEPIANLVAFAVDRERFAFQGVEDNQWNELFREVVGAVVVRCNLLTVPAGHRFGTKLALGGLNWLCWRCRGCWGRRGFVR